MIKKPSLVNPVVIGVDSSTKTGVAVVRIDPEQHCPNILFAKRVHYPKLTGLDRMRAISREIGDICETHGVTFAVIEGYGYKNKFTLSTLVEIGTAIRMTLLQRDCPMGTLSPKSVKLFATGNGAAEKSDMIAYAASRWAYSTKDDNIADALALAEAGLGYCNAVPLTYEQRHTVGLLTLL